ncbi:MAG: SBBP repeat-containing protein [Rhodospirillales bacterium]|nr:SBBP repeat-containing protein [Rhodospirillales bacterium]
MQSKRNGRARWRAHATGVAGVLLSFLVVTAAAPAVAGPAPTWTKQLGTDSYDSFEAVATDSLGNVVAVGQFDYTDPWVVKFNAAGAVLWQKKPGPANLAQADGVATDALNNIIVSMTSRYPYDKWLIKYKADGTPLWTRKFGTLFYGEFRVAVDRFGNIYAAGGTSSGTFSDVILVKYSSTGTPLWSKRYGSDKYDDCNGVAVDKNGNVVLVGTTRGSFGGPNPNSESDAWVAKLDSTGKILWQQQLDSLEYADTDQANAVAVDPGGNILVGGLTYGRFSASSTRGPKAWLAKYSTSGVLTWIRDYDPVGPNREPGILGLAVDSTGNVIATGRSYWFYGSEGAFVAKYSPAGAFLWESLIDSGELDSTYAVAIDRVGNAYVAGSTSGDLGGVNKGRTDAFLAKFPLLP